MTYVFFSDTYIPRPDGVAHSVAWSAEAIRDLGGEVIVVRPDNGDPPRDSRELSLPSSRVPRRDYYVSWSSYFRSVRGWLGESAISSEKIDVVHIHSLGPIGMLGLRYAWSQSKPVVLTWHTDLFSYASLYPEVYIGAVAARSQMLMYSPKRKRDPRAGLSISGTVQKILQSVNSVVAPSAKIANQLTLLCPQVGVVLIPTGLPDYVFRYRGLSSLEARGELGIQADHKLILSVGRLSAEKNPSLTTSTFRAIQSICPNAKCLAVGDPGSRNGRKWQFILGDNGVAVLPSVRHAELLKIYRAADLLLVTSLTETQGLTVVEAHALGLPVVCVDPALAWFGDMAMSGVFIAKTSRPDDVARTSIMALDALSGTPDSAEQADYGYSALSSRSQGEKLLQLYEEVRRHHKANMMRSEVAVR